MRWWWVGVIKKNANGVTKAYFQLDSADEQAAAIRRELDGRMQRVAEMEKVKKLFLFYRFELGHVAIFKLFQLPLFCCKLQMRIQLFWIDQKQKVIV